jgi:hypothetical protein
MKARPRRAERDVAALLSKFFRSIGRSPVERIPVLGRTGPDITLNALGLVVDVKSRIEVPMGAFFEHPVCYQGIYDAVPLAKVADLLISEGIVVPFKSKQVDYWYAHMDEWTQVHQPDGISALVLHRPKMPYGKAMLILKNRRRFIEKCQTMQMQSRLTSPAKTEA